MYLFCGSHKIQESVSPLNKDVVHLKTTNSALFMLKIKRRLNIWENN